MSKELTPLEALETIKIVTEDEFGLSTELNIIEKSLKALEIIKGHKLLNYVLKNEKCASMYHLSKEEIDLFEDIVIAKGDK